MARGFRLDGEGWNIPYTCVDARTFYLELFFAGAMQPNSTPS